MIIADSAYPGVWSPETGLSAGVLTSLRRGTRCRASNSRPSGTCSLAGMSTAGQVRAVLLIEADVDVSGVSAPVTGSAPAAPRRSARHRSAAAAPAHAPRWEIGVAVAEWGIKKMRTRWGTCNVDARRIWLNLELAKKPASCLEYILVHEMVHLLEHHHNDRFRQLMDRLMPQWRLLRDELNRAPLSHEDWTY